MNGMAHNPMGLRIKGRAEKPLIAQVTRDLDELDLTALQEEKGSAPPKVMRLRERHHTLARALADGISQSDAALLCDYSPSRVSILLGDPAFKELVNFYKNQTADRYLDMHAKIAGLGSDAIEELTSRLEETPEEFSVGQLVEVSKMTLDRSGHGPTTKVEADVRFGLADRMERARKRALDHRVQQMKDITPDE